MRGEHVKGCKQGCEPKCLVETRRPKERAVLVKEVAEEVETSRRKQSKASARLAGDAGHAKQKWRQPATDCSEVNTASCERQRHKGKEELLDVEARRPRGKVI